MFKKILTISLLLLIGLVLSACIQETENINSSPTLSGDILISHILGNEFKPLEGVSETDIEDGDLTSNIIVVYNDVNINIPGNYIVVLEVSDSDNNKATLNITVVVEDILANYEESIDLLKLSI